MSVFVDTSAIYAGIAVNDEFHEHAVDTWERLLDRGEDLVTHALIEVESAVLVQRRIGFEAVAALADLLLPRIKVIEVGRDERRAALAAVAARGSREISLVDRVSFDLMHRLGLREAFAFDRHFADAGFDLIGSPG
ncbi:MAG: PIN domain-containing protein [Thermoleophilia bacterium]|nr:PIN domain-containing protein [Thermoleophilia bacterium]